MIRKLSTLGSCLLLCFSMTSVRAENNIITFSSEAWKDATNKDGTGLYWDIFRAVYGPEGYTIETKIRTYERAVNLIKNYKVDVMVGPYIDEIKNVIYPKNYFAVDIVQALSLKNTGNDWNGFESINSKIVGWIKGYSYDDYLPEGALDNTAINRLHNRRTAFALLNKKRLDYFIDAKADISDFLNSNTGYNAEDFVRNTILELKLYIVFTDDEKGKKLARIFDDRFSLLLAGGEIKKLYEKYKNSTMTYPQEFN